MEKIVKSSIINYIDANNILSERQYGFVPGRSTTLQLLKVTEHWTDILDKGGAVDVIYLDFKKAFDSVPHYRLLHKLENTGIPDPTLTWLRAFLSGRVQRVVVQGTASEDRPVISGVPQGSVLGPVLFTMYINDLPDCVRSFLYLFADDAKLYRQIQLPVDQYLMQCDLTNMEGWSDEWLLMFHPDKSGHMRLGPNRQGAINTTYTLLDTQLRQSVEERDLGVSTDSLLSFNNHIVKATGKANRIMGVIRRAYVFLSEKNFPMLFKALVRPHLEYAQPVWQPHRRGLIDRLEKVQRRATRQISNLRGLSYPGRLRRLQLPTLVFRRLRGDIIETFKILNGVYDRRASSDILHLSEHHRTRGHSLKLQTFRCHRDIKLHSFGHRTAAPWNSLPEAVVTAPSTKAFERRLDKFWEDHPLKWDPSAETTFRRPTTSNELNILARLDQRSEED
jgi:hypothetical protein